MTIMAPEAAGAVIDDLGGVNIIAPKLKRAAPAVRARTKPPAKAKGPVAAPVRTPIASRAAAHAGSTARQGLKPPKVGGLGKLSGLGGSGNNAHKVVVAEFALSIVLIGTTPIFTRAPKNGRLYVANDFVRLTAVCVLFFVLALTANTPKWAKASAAFGGLVTLGILYNATSGLTAMGAIFTNAKAAGGNIEAAAAGTETVSTATYTPTDLYADPSNGMALSPGSSSTASVSNAVAPVTTETGGVVSA